METIEIKRIEKPSGNSEAKSFTRPNLEMPEIAWRGLFKDYRDLVAETTEASDAFHYAAFLQVLGCMLGRRLCVYHAGQQFPNFYTCVVGRSGLTRKDTASARGRIVLERLHVYHDDNVNPPFKIVRGIRSYEGLLDELAGDGKIRLILLGELLSLFAKAGQQSLSNIIPSLTELYDCPDLLNPPVHQEVKPAKAPFLSIMAGTTQDWLQKALTEKDIYGGFANRWLYFYGLPKNPMPNPPKIDQDELNHLVSRLNHIRDWAANVPQGEIHISDEASKLFETFYNTEFYPCCQQPGLIPALIVRIQDFIWKIGLLYAVEAECETISGDHLEAAIAVGKYLEESVVQVFASFGESKGKKDEMRVLEHLRGKGGPVKYRDVHRNLNFSSAELEAVVKPLIQLGLIKNQYIGRERYLEAV